MKMWCSERHGTADRLVDDPRGQFARVLAIHIDAVQAHKHRAVLDATGIESGLEVASGLRANIALGSVTGLISFAAADPHGAIVGVRGGFEIGTTNR